MNGQGLNLNIHFHMMFLDGVYELDSSGTTGTFRAIATPTSVEMNSLLLDGFDDDVINELQGSSITYLIAVGSQRDKKVFTLKTLPARDEEVDETNGQTLAKGWGFSLWSDCRMASSVTN